MKQMSFEFKTDIAPPKMWESIPKEVMDEISKEIQKRKKSHKEEKFYYFVFDAWGENVLLYAIRCLYSHYSSELQTDISIKKVYYITKKYVKNLIDGHLYRYDHLDDEDTIAFFYMNICDYGLYINFMNMGCLKNTIYRYSSLYDVPSKKLSEHCNFYDLAYIPLCIPQFEYFIKNKFYNLAFSCDNYDSNCKSLYQVIGLGKDYYDFIRKYDLRYDEVEILKLVRKKDYNLIKELSYFDDRLWYLSTHSISITSVLDYFKKKKYSFDDFIEYTDYIRMAIEQGFDIKNHSILFPDNLREEHDRLASRSIVIDDYHVKDDIDHISKVLSFNVYEDEKYIIFPANSISGMIKEAREQHNCLINYCSSYGSGDSLIFFMRKKEHPDESFVTIELSPTNRLVQARGKYNKEVSEEVMNVIREWQKTLIPITFE